MTVGHRVEPTDCDYWLIRMIKPWRIPGVGDAMTCRSQETGILPIRHRKFADRKGIYPDPMHRLLILLSGAAAHQEVAGWDDTQLGLDNERRVMRTEC